MKSILSWQGGKGKMRKKIVSMFPPGFVCYAETMVGGASVLFTLPLGVAKTEYINDTDGNLINFWHVIKTQKDAFIESFAYTPKSRTLFYQYREQYTNGNYASDVERAHIFFYLCKVGFGSRMTSPTFGTSSERASSLNYRTLERSVTKAWERMQDVMIDNRTYQFFVQERDKDTTHFFIDPPYHGTSGYSTDAWGEEHFRELAEVCHGIHGTFLLTINDTPFIREVFQDFHIHEHEFQYCMSKTENDQIVNELIVTNYKVPTHTIARTHIEKRLTQKATTLSLF